MLLSYNLHFHVAYPELIGLIRAHAIDVLCLQECFAGELADKLGKLKLAAKTSTGELGLAIYYDPTRFSVRNCDSVPLPLSAYERLRAQERERLLIVELFDRRSRHSFFVASFHATHLIASNALRRQQLKLALSTLNDIHDEQPSVLVGDFNYPFFHERLKDVVQGLGYDLLIPASPTYNGRHFQGRFDMAALANTNAQMQVLPFDVSDHAPILLRVSKVKPKRTE